MRAIDCLHLGRERVICCWQVGEVLVDPGPSSCLDTLLAALGDWRPRALLLTHIHLDHAGASGTLAARWPDLEVYVHERGAPHMASPERLLHSAQRLYGEHMDFLWGAFEAVPEDRLRVLRGGERLRVGDDQFEVAYTPGHASHHVSYLHGDGTAFTGDTAGVRITPDGPVIPPTPPPDIDPPAWHGSLRQIAAWQPQTLAYTHWGASDQVSDQLEQLGERLDRWGALARAHDAGGFEQGVREELAAATPLEAFAAYEQAVPFEQSYAGLRRYWDTRAEGS